MPRRLDINRESILATSAFTDTYFVFGAQLNLDERIGLLPTVDIQMSDLSVIRADLM
jgi:hypothetical protein